MSRPSVLSSGFTDDDGPTDGSLVVEETVDSESKRPKSGVIRTDSLSWGPGCDSVSLHGWGFVL